jgi:hypothetical protein
VSDPIQTKLDFMGKLAKSISRDVRDMMAKQTDSSAGKSTNTLSRELERKPDQVQRFMSETDRSKLGYEYIVADATVMKLETELAELRKKFRRLKKAARRDLAEARQLKQRLQVAFQTGMMIEPMQYPPSAQTNIITEE